MKKVWKGLLALSFLSLPCLGQVSFDGGLLGTGVNWETAVNWDGNAVPTDSADVVIPDDLLAYNVEINSDVIVNDLNLFDNNLTVNPGASLVIYGTLTMGALSDLTTNSGNVILMEGANIIQDLTADITGNVEMRRDGKTNDRVYNYWSSPVDFETYRDVFLSFPGNDVDSNDMYWFDDTAQNADTSGSNSGWTLVNPDDTIPTARGFLATGIEGDNGTPTRAFVGAANNGAISLDLNIGALVNGSYFVLTGNPYPSAISLDLFLTTNTLISDVYLWDDNNGINYRSDYITANSLGASGGNSGVTDVDYIATSQGFFVDAGPLGLGSVAINFNNAMRVAANNGDFYRHSKPYERFYLNVETPDLQYGNQTLIGFHPMGTPGKDLNLDSRKLKGNPYVSLYSLMDAEPDYIFAIQALNELVDSVLVPLGIELTISDSLVFSLSTSNLGEHSQVFLHDFETNQRIPLLTQTYKVYLSQGVYEGRFALEIDRRQPQVGVEELDGQGSMKVVQNSLWYAYEEGGLTLEMMDLNGRMVYREYLTPASAWLALPELPYGMYLIRLFDAQRKPLETVKYIPIK